MKTLYTTFVIALISINSFSQVPNWEWAKNAGGSGSEVGNYIATDASGNVYATGNYNSSTISFGSTTLTNAGSDDIFLVKYDAAGNVLWAKSIGGPLNDYSTSVATDLSGNVYITGYYYSSTIVFGAFTLTHNGGVGYDMFVVKYDSNGTALWADNIGGSSGTYGICIATDDFNGVYITGSFTSTISFGTTILNAAAGSSGDIFVVKYNSNGNVIWAKSAGGSSDDYSWGIATDASSNVFVTGWFQSPTISFGTITLTNTDNTGNSIDMFIVKYDPNGNSLWAKSGIGSHDDVGHSVATDVLGNVYVTGGFRSPSISFDTINLTNADNTGNSDDIFILKYNPVGNLDWALREGGAFFDIGLSITSDVSGIYITGVFASSNITFGTTTLINPGNYDAFVVKYDSPSSVIWAINAGGTDNGAYCISADISGIYITGSFFGSTTVFGTNILTGGGDEDVFIAKLNSSTGVFEDQLGLGFSVYPNPFSYQTTLTFNEHQKNTIIKITDTFGKEIKKLNFTGIQIEIAKENLKAGVYFVQSIDERNYSSNSKIIIQ